MEKEHLNGEKKTEKQEAEEIKKYGLGIRHLQAACMSLCITALIMVRSSMGVAVLAMSDHDHNNGTIYKDIAVSTVATYDWDKTTQAVILSSFFWGYTLMQIPAGILSKKLGGKPLLLVAIVANGVICLSVPWIASVGGWQFVCVARMAIGLTQACTYPGSHTLVGQWLPDHERTMVSGIIYSGTQLGTILGMPLAGLLADTSTGWPMIFYASAALMAVTAVMWYYCTASSPALHSFITTREREYIERSMHKGKNDECIRTPWKDLLLSRPVWVLVVTHVGVAYVWVMFFVDLPTYIEKGLKISLKNSAALSSLPYIGMWAGSIASGIISEKMFNKGVLSAAGCRKTFNSIGIVGLSSGLIGLGFLGPDNSTLAIALLIISNTLGGFVTSGFFMNHLDLSPNFAGLLMSLTNFVANLGSVVNPIVTSTILQNNPADLSRWRIVFLVTAAISLSTNLVFVIFGTSDRQPWDNPSLMVKQNADSEDLKTVIKTEKNLMASK